MSPISNSDARKRNSPSANWPDVNVGIQGAAALPNLALVLANVARERVAQQMKWGQQNHPDGTGPMEVHLYDLPTSLDSEAGVGFVYADDFEAWATTSCETHAAADDITYADILLEEVAEALATGDPKQLRTELIQVAAVAVAWVEKLDREEAARHE